MGGWSEGVVNFQVVLCDNPLELEGEQYTVGKHFSNSFHPPWLFSITVKGGQTKHERSITSDVVTHVGPRFTKRFLWWVLFQPPQGIYVHRNTVWGSGSNFT